MKKLLLLSAIFLSLSTQAATVGTLNLIGIVPKKVEITVTPKPSASTLDLTTTATDLSVGTVTGKSNVNAGYKITIVSANTGKLINSVASPTLLTQVGYTMKLDAASVNLAAPTQLNFTGKSPFTKDVTVSYTGIDAVLYEEGNFTDTVTFTISAN